MAIRLPDGSLKRAGAIRRLLLAGAVMLGAVAVGLLPVPSGVLMWASPGLHAAYPHAGWSWLSLAPEQTFAALLTGTLALTVAATTALWSAQRGGRSGAAFATVFGVAVLCVVASLHVALGLDSLFGFIPLTHPLERFFAPLVNPNHLASVLLILLPVTLGEAVQHRDENYGLFAGAVTIAGGLLFAALASGGAVLAVLLVGLYVAARTVRERPGLAAVLTACVVGLGTAAVYWVTQVETTWRESSFDPRIAQYVDQPAVVSQFWLFGSGAGTYATAYKPYRTLLTFQEFTHAHSEPLQWMVETGIVGVAAAVIAWWLLPPVISSNRAAWWGLGILAAALHAFVDFAPHIPGVLLIMAAAIGVHRGGFGKSAPTRPATVRRWLIALLCIQIAATGWRVRGAVVDNALPKMLMFEDQPELARSAANRVTLLAPWRPESGLTRAWLTNGDDRADRARHLILRFPDDADTLRRSAALLMTTGETEDAVEALHRATERDVGDYRSWALLARAQRESEPNASAQSWASAIVRWPWGSHNGRPLSEGYDAYPVGLFWVDALDDARAPWLASLGQLLHSRGDDSSALLAYERAAAQDERYHWIPDRAQALNAIGDPGGAEEWLDACSEHSRLNPNYYTVRGELMLTWGRPEEAVLTYLQGAASLPHITRTSALAVGAAKHVSPERAIQVAEDLASSGQLTPRAAHIGAEQALSVGRFGVCVNLLQQGNTVLSDLSDVSKTLWSDCASECGDCSAAPE
jgi:tetratricopeptide (TPR) repeat protein